MLTGLLARLSISGLCFLAEHACMRLAYPLAGTAWNAS